MASSGMASMTSLILGMGIQEAIAEPRIHIEGADPKMLEGKLVKEMFVDSRIKRETMEELKKRGHVITLKLDGDFALPVGVMRDSSTGMLHSGVTVSVPATAMGF